MAEQACGKDTPSGHWESAGVVLDRPFGVFDAPQNSFPPELLAALRSLCNCPACWATATRRALKFLIDWEPNTSPPASRLSTHRPIRCFKLQRTNRASPARLLTLCELARALLAPVQHRASLPVRLSAMPQPVSSAPATAVTMPCIFAGTHAVGCCVCRRRRGDWGRQNPDIFAAQGAGRSVHASGHDALFDATLDALTQAGDGALIATNFVDFDSTGIAAMFLAMPPRWSTSMRVCRNYSSTCAPMTCCCSVPTTAAIPHGRAVITPASKYRCWRIAPGWLRVHLASGRVLPIWAKALPPIWACRRYRQAAVS